jgi:hypothetical protein
MQYQSRTHLAFSLVLGLSFAVSYSFSFGQPYTFNTLIGSATDPGYADGTNANAQFSAPTGLTADSAGTLYVADGNRLRSISISGTNRILRTLAGTTSHFFADGINTIARFNAPQGVAVDAAGNLYVADTFNNAIRKVTPLGPDWVVTTIAGPSPPGLAPPSGSADGTNNAARFDNPYGIAVDAATNVYVADTLNHTIRKLTPIGLDWVVTTIAGVAGTNGAANGSNNVARFSSPSSITIGPSGVLYVTDLDNNTIRQINRFGTNWAVTTLAGTPGNIGSADGTGATASFHSPQCIAADAGQNLFVTDSLNFTIRKITQAGVVSTVAGSAGFPGAADGTGTAARFMQPFGVVVNSSGVLFVADYGGYDIRQGQLALLHWNASGNNLILSWSASLSGFFPERAGQIGGPWTPLPTNAIALSGQSFYLTNPIAPGNSWYRLHQTLP